MTFTHTAKATAPTRPAQPRKPWALRLLDWLSERDRRYREAAKLRRLPKERLDDIGLRPEQVEDVLR